MKHTIFRFIFLLISYIPLGVLMFVGRPRRLQGILYDVNNFFGLELFVKTLFFIGFGLVCLDTLKLVFKKKKRKYLTNIFFLLLFIGLYFYSIENNVFYKVKKAKPTKVEENTLIISTEGSVYNFNIDAKEIKWQYRSESKVDTNGNVNQFAIYEQNIIMPFESGKLISFDVNTGKIIWKQQIYGQLIKESGIGVESQNKEINKLAPLFHSKPFVDDKSVVIASVGERLATTPFLYKFDKKTGEKKWQTSLQSHYNFYAPIKFKAQGLEDFYFVNSAVFLCKISSEYGTNYTNSSSYLDRFPSPIYSQMQTDGNHIFIEDEYGKIYCLKLDENGGIVLSEKYEETVDNSNSPFKWIFKDGNFTDQGTDITFLEDNILYIDLKTYDGGESHTERAHTICALKAKTGKILWKKLVKGNIESWSLAGNKIIGYTEEKKMFYLDKDGSNFTQIEIRNKPSSNIERIDKTRFVFVSEKGVEIFDTKTNQSNVVFWKYFKASDYPNVQIKYISK